MLSSCTGSFKGRSKGIVVDLYSASIRSVSKALRYSTHCQEITQFYLHILRFIHKWNEPYLPLPSQLYLVLIYRPRRDGRLSRPWCEVAQAEIRTCNLPIANPTLYHTATSTPHSAPKCCVDWLIAIWHCRRRRLVTMDVKLHQLLPLMMLFVANLPTGSSVFQFRPQSNIDVLRTARLEAYSAQPGGWSKLDVKCSRVKKVVKKAAEQFNVTSADIIQAFHKVCWRRTV